VRDLSETKDLAVWCRECSRRVSFTVLAIDYADWQIGRYAQDAFPYLTDDQRELLISETCGSCFDEMFPEEEED